ncbi:hypothetical protein GEMRC1_008951 [Eukaryota sp. GEM-RC1]
MSLRSLFKADLVVSAKSDEEVAPQPPEEVPGEVLSVDQFSPRSSFFSAQSPSVSFIHVPHDDSESESGEPEEPIQYMFSPPETSQVASSPPERAPFHSFLSSPSVSFPPTGAIPFTFPSHAEVLLHRSCSPDVSSSQQIIVDTNSISSNSTQSDLKTKTDRFSNIIVVATLEHDKTGEDFVYKIFNIREEVLRFAKLCIDPKYVNYQKNTIDFDSIPQTLLDTVGFCGPRGGLLDFLSRNSPSCYHFFKSVSPSPGLYLALDDDQLTFILWPGDLPFSPQSSPILTFMRLLLEFCSDIFFILSETIASQLEVVAKRPRKVKRSFTAEKHELTPDDFQVSSTQLFEIPSFNDPVVECHLSPNGTKFGVLEVRSLVLSDQKIKISELWPILDQFRVCFDSLSDEKVKKVLSELHKSMGNYTNTSYELKGILEQFFKNESELDTDLTDCRNEIQEQFKDKSDLEQTLRQEVTIFIQKFNLLRRSVSEISFNPTCSICKDPDCVHRFTCCKNCVCNTCGDMLANNDFCVLCLASPCLGIETGPSLQEEQFQGLRGNFVKAIAVIISNELNPPQSTVQSLLKSDIIRHILDNNDGPLINSIVEEAITSAVTNHYEPTLVAASKLEEGIVDKSQKLLQSIRNNFSNHFCSDKTKPLLVCKSLHNGVLNCERSSKENSLMFSQIPPSFLMSHTSRI